MKATALSTIRWGLKQARSQVLRFGEAQCIFMRTIFLIWFMFKTYYFVDFQILTGQHIASGLLLV